MGGEDSHTCVIPTARGKCKRKEGDSEEEEDEDDDSEDQGDDDEEDEEDSGGKKGKKAEACEEEVSNGMMLFTGASSRISVCCSKCHLLHWPHTNEISSSRTTVYTQPAWKS